MTENKITQEMVDASLRTPMWYEVEEKEKIASFSEETQELLEDSPCKQDALDFIEAHGEKAFVDHFETYVELFDQYQIAAIDAFIELWSVEDLDHFQDAYYGEYRSGAEFAECFARDCGDIPSELPSWIEIDWKESWRNLEFDFHEYDGYIFNANW